MFGGVGAQSCKCTQFVQFPGIRDCYTCGHLARDHKGLGRISVEGQQVKGLRLLLR